MGISNLCLVTSVISFLPNSVWAKPEDQFFLGYFRAANKVEKVSGRDRSF
jgi:hypothetical protein